MGAEVVFGWIPYFSAENYDAWQKLGFDFATMQPNFAFRNTTTSRFADVANMTSTYHLGVEMELPLAVRNHLLPGLVRVRTT